MMPPRATMTPSEEAEWVTKAQDGRLRRELWSSEFPARRRRRYGVPGVPRLSLQEARIVRELSRGPASTAILADAIGQMKDWPASRNRVHASVQCIRRKFGSACIVSLPGVGFKLGGVL